MANHIRLLSRCLWRSSTEGGNQIRTSLVNGRFRHLQLPLQQLSTSRSVLEKEKQPSEEEGGEGWSTKRKIMAGVAAGGLVGGMAYGYYSHRKTKSEIMKNSGKTTTISNLLSERPPDFPPARKIRGGHDTTGLKITLFQYQTCPFCCKARAFLDYFGFNYDVVEVNSVLRTQVKWSEYKKVPIVVIEYGDKVLQLNDSALIVSALYSFLVTREDPEKLLMSYPTYKFTDPADRKEKLDISNKYFIMFMDIDVKKRKEEISEERKWRKWTDDTLVHMLSPNVYRTPQESLDTFKWFNKAGDWENLFSDWERYLVIYVGAAAMWLIAKRLKKRHKIKDDVRQALYDECNFWVKTVKKKKSKFLGGDSPNLADLNVFGVLSAIEGCQAFEDVRNNTKIGDWFDNMKEAVGKREGQMLLTKIETQLIKDGPEGCWEEP